MTVKWRNWFELLFHEGKDKSILKNVYEFENINENGSIKQKENGCRRKYLPKI